MTSNSNLGLVSEILMASGNMEKDDLKAQLRDCTSKIEDIKYDVAKIVRSCYSEIHSGFCDSESLSKDLKDYNEICQELNHKIEKLKPQLSTVVSESDKVVQEIEKTSFLINTLKILVDVGSLFTNFDSALSQNDFYEAAQILDKAKLKLTDVPCDVAEYLEMFKAFKSEFTVKKERLKFELGKMWSKMFIWNCDTDHGIYKLSIRNIDENSHKEAELFFKTVALLNMLDQHFKIFKKSVINFLVKPILTKTVKLQISKDNAYIVIEVSECGRDKPEAECVFINLQTLFTVLNNSFLNIKVTMPQQENEVPLAYVLGKIMSEEFCQALISEGLLDWKTRSSSGSLTAIAGCATNLQNQLVDMQFLDCSANVFGHTQNFNSIISNKMCQDIFQQARTTLKKDLHRTVFLKLEKSSDTLESCELNQSHIKKLFEFPECAVR